MQSTLTVIATVALIGLSSAQAPGDEDGRCNRNPYDHTYPDNVKVLMDSWNYENLLPGSGSGSSTITNAVWDDVSCDSNDHTSITSPTYWQHGGGGICRFQSQVCGFSQGDQDNWLFTQHISKAVPATDTYTVRVFVNVTFTFRNCRERSNCSSRFKINRYFTNTQQSAAFTCSDKSLYSSSGITPNNVFGPERNNLKVTSQRHLDMTTSQDGLYLALQDTSQNQLRGTCVTISRFLVYRHECRGKSVGLVRYPATQAPVSGMRSVTTQCVNNAHNTSSLSVTCDFNGNWGNENLQCECDDGYVDANGKCTPCPAGTYSSSETCITCPDNTVTNEVATGQCECVSGYFRNTIISDTTCGRSLSVANENAMTGCTAPPSFPNNVTVLVKSATQIQVTWSHPSQTGGRSDLYYIVEHSDPDSLGDFTGTTCKGPSATSHTYSNLRPATQYCIRVNAHNGVSDQDPDGAATRYTEQCATTPEAAPGPVDEITGRCSVIVWKEPELPNGEIIKYKLTFFTKNEEVDIETDSTQTFYVIESRELLPKGSPIFVQVYAINKAGEGNFTEGVYIGCEDPSEEIEKYNKGTKVPLPDIAPGIVTDVEVVCNVIYWKEPSGRVSNYVVVVYTENGEEEIETDVPYLKLKMPKGNYSIKVCTVVDEVRGCSGRMSLNIQPVQSEEPSSEGYGNNLLIIVGVATFVGTATVTALLFTCVFAILNKRHNFKNKAVHLNENDYEMKT